MQKSISIETRRYSTLIKRIFEEYNKNVVINIDGARYDENDIPKLLNEWCTNNRIKSTLDFSLYKNGVLLFGFHDDPGDFYAAMSELEFIERLASEKIIRFKKQLSQYNIYRIRALKNKNKNRYFNNVLLIIILFIILVVLIYVLRS